MAVGGRVQVPAPVAFALHLPRLSRRLFWFLLLGDLDACGGELGERPLAVTGIQVDCPDPLPEHCRVQAGRNRVTGCGAYSVVGRQAQYQHAAYVLLAQQ